MPYLELENEPCGQCLECGEPIVYGRPDRKFCSASCKNRYHNKRACPVRGMSARAVMHILQSNHEILCRLIRMGIRNIDLLSVTNLGFDTRYMTSYCKQNGHRIYTCLDIVYELTPSRIKKIAFLGEGVVDEKIRNEIIAAKLSPPASEDP